MEELRVIVKGNSSDGFSYRVEQICKDEEGIGIVGHGPDGLASASNMSGLKKRLMEMLAACDKPPMTFIPSRLVELDGKHWMQ